jgi:hypothetical protein
VRGKEQEDASKALSRTANKVAEGAQGWQQGSRGPVASKRADSVTRGTRGERQGRRVGREKGEGK